MGFSFKKAIGSVGKSIGGAVKDIAEAPVKTVSSLAKGDLGGAAKGAAGGFMGGPGGAANMSGQAMVEQGIAGGMQPQQEGLPSTGIQRQVNSLGAAPPLTMPQSGSQLPQARTSISQLASTLAQSYGLNFRGALFDQAGNPLVTPDQLAQSSGQSSEDVAGKMGLISQAIQRRQQEQQQTKSQAALQAGVNLVGSRSRGSLALMQSGLYQDLAQLYQSQQYEAADFSYWIQKSMFDRTMALEQQKLKAAKKGAQGQFLGNLVGGGINLLAGNYPGAIGNLAGAFGSGGSTGWF